MKVYEAPIFFNKNRVFRTYTGGKLLGEFVGDGSPDSYYPEEWIASSVKSTMNSNAQPKEGVSVVEGEGVYLDDLIAQYPQEILGPKKKEVGVLVKFLDSAIRLPAQTHPDKTYARKHFDSEHGKEESWIVLAKRPNGCVFFGFKDGVTREEFAEAIERSYSDKNIMETLMVRREIEVGDVIFVPAKTVHAIGEGCLMLEVQEPTDYTIQPEHWCGDMKLTEHDMFLGLDRETALDCFDYDPVDEVKLEPELMAEKKGVRTERLIGSKQTENFGVNRISLSGGEFVPDKAAGIYVITDGTGTVEGENYHRDLKRGDYFMLPHVVSGSYVLSGNMTVMECFAS